MKAKIIVGILLLEMQVAVFAENKPILHWTFDAPQGTPVLDVTGNDRHGEIGKLHHQHPLPTWHPTKGVKNGAIRVESRSKIEARKIHPLGESWVLSFWYLQEYPEINGNMFARLPEVDFQCFGDKLNVNINKLGKISAKRITPGNWENVVLDIKPGMAKLYLNGFLAGKLEKKGWKYDQEGGKLFFGAPDWHRQYRGLIDEAQLFIGDVSGEQIAELSLECYHPDAPWIKSYSGPMLKLIEKGKMSKNEIEYLKKIGAPDTEELMKILASGQPSDQAKAAFALGALQDPKAFQPLIEMLKNPAPQLSIAACPGLALMGNPEAVPALEKQVKDGLPEMRKAAIKALAALGEPGQKALIECLNTRRFDIMQDVANELKKSKYKPGNNPEGVRYWMALNDWRKVGESGSAGAPALVDALGLFSIEIKFLNMRSVQHVGHPEAIVPAIQKTIVYDRNIPNKAEQCLVKLGKDSSGALASGLKDDDLQVRIRSAEIIGKIKDPAAVPALIGALPDKDARVVVAVADALQEMKDPAASEALIATLENPDFFARETAANALGKIGEPAGPALLNSLGTSKGNAKVEIIRAIGLAEISLASPQLIQSLSDDNWQVRARTAEALGKIGDTANAASVISILQSDKDWTVRLMAAKSLGYLRTAETLAALKIASENDAAQIVRRQAKISLEQKGLANKTDLLPKEEARMLEAPEYNQGKFVQPAADKIKLSKSAGKGKEIFLPGTEVTVQGESAKVGDDGAIGFWAPEDVCHWKFKLPEQGKYEVFILQSAISSYAGSEYKIVCNGQELKGKIIPTAHWGDFAEESVGVINLNKPGEYVISVVPTKVVKWVMNCAGLRLKRIK